MVGVARPDRDERKPRRYRVEERLTAARLAPAIANLQHIGVQLRTLMLAEPLFLGTLGVSPEQHPHVAVLGDELDARQIRIVERRGPRGIRSEDAKRDAV